MNNPDTESLLTPKSFNLSLAPPRGPPYKTAHYALYCGQDPRKLALTNHHTLSSLTNSTHEEPNRIYEHLSSAYKTNKNVANPHLRRAPLLSDQSSRILSTILPVWLQNKGRDSGFFRSLCDGLVTSSIPSVAITHLHEAKIFIDLTQEGRIDWKYGPHPMQKIDLFLPKGDSKTRGFVFFVHGGAWGSGKPFMYRMVAKPFLDANIAVAIVGYRTYPDGNVPDQVDDLHMAATRIAMEYPHLLSKPQINDGSNDNDDWVGVCLMGHSSGAHISMMYLVQLIEQKLHTTTNQQEHGNTPSIQFDSYVGLSGVYSISDHFDYESMRGVEEISPMKPACGFSREAFDYYSPAIRLRRLLRDNILHDHVLHSLLPDILLVHGVEDDIVPFTSTSLAGLILKGCGVTNCECYIPVCGHSDVVMHMMLGGRARDEVLHWLCHGKRKSKQSQMISLGSKL